ncbi:AAA family ATPase [Bradyrhizobium sp. HKCCYLS2038]|uniref:AAA family ATPase n=1 Tax=unclassified Bradyrhizobium TaxID=2631580 RepID=UPI003EB99CCC
MGTRQYRNADDVVSRLMGPDERSKFRFGRFELDLRRGGLFDSEGEIELRPKTFEVLCHLVVNAGRLVRKDEIMDAVWSRVTVSDGSLTQCISEIRSALGDHNQHMIRTVARRGYVFAAPMLLASTSATDGETPVGSSAPATDPALHDLQPAEKNEPSAAVHASERRELTILAGEWVDLAALSAALDPEDLQVAMSACFDRCVAIAARYHGHVARKLDDGVQIYFGYPLAGEHDAENAVRAGLDMMAQMMVPSGIAGAAGSGRPMVRMRIGIASGMVLMAETIRRGPRQPDAVGVTPHLTKRLMAQAPAGGVLIDDRTRRLAGEWFDCQMAEPVQLDGAAGPVGTWRVVGARQVDSRFEALRAIAVAPLVGRRVEAELLRRAWRRAAGGDGQLVMISGEPGVGKSRLAREQLYLVAGERHAVVQYSCSPQHSDSALYPFIRQLKRAAGLSGGVEPSLQLDRLDASLMQVPADRRARLAELLEIPIDDRYPAFRGTPQERRESTMDALIDCLENEARRQPLIVIVEDLQWIDPSSLEVLCRSIPGLARLPVLMMLTFRPEFKPPWRTAANATQLPLDRLTIRECRTLIGQVAGPARLSEDVTEQLIARSDGVPLFLEELTRAATAAGVPASRHRPSMDVAAPVPPTLSGVLLARIDRLGPAREAAQIGAVIGREFSRDLVAAATGWDESKSTEMFDRLIDSGIVVRDAGSQHASFVFRHALVQDAAYATLARERRRELHRRVADALRTQPPLLGGATPEIIARHYFEAGSLQDAVMFWSEAADLATRRVALEEALAHLCRAIEVADGAASAGAPWASSSLRVKLYIAYGQALLWARSLEETIEAFARARELAAELDDPSERLSTYYGLWASSLVFAQVTYAGETADAFMRDAKIGARPDVIAVAHRIVGTTLWHRADFSSARANLEQALAMGARGHDPRFGPDLDAAASMMLAATLWCEGELDRARRLREHAVARATEGGSVLTMVYVTMYHLIMDMVRGDATAAALRSPHHVALCREHGLRHIAYAEICRAASRWGIGERDGTLDELRRAIDKQRSYGQTLGLPWSLSLRAQAERDVGQIEASLDSIEAAVKTAEQTGELWYVADLHRLRGEILLAKGTAAAEAGEAALRVALSTAQQQQARSYALRAALSLARRLAGTGRRAEAHDVLAPAVIGFSATPELPEIELALALQADLAAGLTAQVKNEQAAE